MQGVVAVNSLMCESLINPLCLHTLNPRFSWVIETDAKNAVQEMYRIIVLDGNGNTVWDSGDVRSCQSVFVEYDGSDLSYSAAYFWRVKVCVNGVESDWSGDAFFETSLKDWTAAFIAADDTPESSECKLFRRLFSIKKSIKSARVHATSLGLYEIYVNEASVSDTCFNPGWTSYDKRVLYCAYDITHLIKQGDNEFIAHIAPGWYKGDLTTFAGARNFYGKSLALSLEISITYDDNSIESIKTDELWSFADSPIVFAELYHGETYDARKEIPECWTQARHIAAGAMPAGFSVEPFDSVPVRRQEVLKPVDFFTTPGGDRVLDFGQNLTGRVRFSISARTGDTIKLRHAEVLDKDGNFYVENLRTARCTNTYIFKGVGVETYEPMFTFQGFRYVSIDDFPYEADPSCFEAVVLHSDMKPIGSFSCSDPLINQLQSNITWGMKSNFLDIPTDCPQRDERLGWTGDAQVFASTACFLYDVLPFFRKWLCDLSLDQRPDGGVPFIIPDILKDRPEVSSSHSSCGWGDTSVIIPWTLYKEYGDKSLLETQYESMKSWVGYIQSQSNDYLWNTGFHFGDWVALDAKEGESIGATPTDLCATAYSAYSTQLLQKTADALGKMEDSETYGKLHSNIVKAYQDEFFTQNGELTANTQTAYILSLMFDLVPEAFISKTVEQLINLIDEYGGHMVTGFLGTPYFCHVLSDNGRLDDAYKLLQREEYPSWLYQVKKGATTIWEHLDSIKPDGSMWSAEMNSFNHYAYGAVGDWLYRVIAGISSAEPGYKKIRIAPRVGGTLTWAEAELFTPYGRVKSRWERAGNSECNVCVSIPPNTTAEIVLPDDKSFITGSGKYCYTVSLRE